MTRRTLGLSDALHQYLLDTSLREPELLRRLRQETARLPQANMQIAPEQGQFLALLVRLMGARQALELGVFTGYSALWVAWALPPEGRLVACDHTPEWTRMAQSYWAEAGVATKIDLRVAPALQTLERLVDTEQGAGAFDFAFIDADKENYLHYYEYCLRLLRPGGMIAIDNVLWDGRVTDSQSTDPATQAIRHFNAYVARDDRVDLSMIPIADGLTLALKR